MFTHGQKERMQACLNSSIAHRNNLWQTQNLIATGVWPDVQPLCKAEFTSDKTTVCASSSIQFENRSYSGAIDSVRWTFQGGNPAQSNAFNPLVTYSNAGKFDVSLRAYAGGQSVETSQTRYVTVLPSNSFQTFPYAESFEDQPSLDGLEWFETSVDSLNSFQLSNAAAATGSSSVYLSNYNNTANTKDELIGPALDLTGASQINLAFKYAYAPKDSSNKDQLLVYVSKNCNSSWVTRLNLTGNNLFTAPATQSQFVPTASDWKQVSANIPSSYFQSGFRFKFVFISRGANDFYLDDINVDASAGIHENGLFEDVRLYPNPSSGPIRVDFSLLEPQNITYAIFNSIGTLVYSKSQPIKGVTGTNTFDFVANGLPNGLYFIKLNSEKGQILKPFILQY
jgi:PKD repeat protein